MKWLTNILNKFRKPEPEQEDFEDFSDPILENDDIRATIDTAIHVYNWLEEMDLDGPTVLNMRGMKNKLKKCRKQCLELVAFNIDMLVVDDEKKEDEEDE